MDSKSREAFLAQWSVDERLVLARRTHPSGEETIVEFDGDGDVELELPDGTMVYVPLHILKQLIALHEQGGGKA